MNQEVMDLFTKIMDQDTESYFIFDENDCTKEDLATYCKLHNIIFQDYFAALINVSAPEANSNLLTLKEKTPTEESKILVNGQGFQDEDFHDISLHLRFMPKQNTVAAFIDGYSYFYSDEDIYALINGEKITYDEEILQKYENFFEVMCCYATFEKFILYVTNEELPLSDTVDSQWFQYTNDEYIYSVRTNRIPDTEFTGHLSINIPVEELKTMRPDEVYGKHLPDLQDKIKKYREAVQQIDQSHTKKKSRHHRKQQDYAR